MTFQYVKLRHMTSLSLRSCLEAGLRAHQAGDFAHAMAAYQRALAMAPENAEVLNLLGTALLQSGMPAEAADHLQRAARKQRGNAGLLGNLAQAYFALERYEESREIYRKASRIDPRNPHFPLGVATTLAIEGKFADAERLLRTLASRFPDAAPVWFNLGNALRDQQRPEEAADCYRRVLKLEPQAVDARNNLGSALHALLRFEEAEREYRECVSLAPDYLIARGNLASVLIDQGRFREAETACRALIEAAPETALAHTMLGSALGHQGRLLEALECHRAAAKLAPDDVKAAATLAGSLCDLGQFDEGLCRLAATLAADPASTSARQMLGTALLARGSLAEGWMEYGYRPALGRLREKYATLDLGRTMPADLTGKHVCVLREQGLGDELFFLRYVRSVAARGARITYRASDKIKSLIERIAGIDRVIDESTPLPDADAAILVGDLPHACSMLPASPLTALTYEPAPGLRGFSSRIAVYWPPVPPSVVIAPLQDRLAAMRARLSAAGDPPYIALTWRAGTAPDKQLTASWLLHKEIPVPALADSLREVPGTVIALQRNPGPGECDALGAALGRQAHDFTEINEDLEDMLALLALIDEYIGVSNTNVHLRAAVGRSARVLVPCPPEWRWMHGRKYSAWFPAFPTYRQSPQGDWSAALALLRADLARRRLPA
jgi:tetratricopeptide (TPR) repeat protein